MKTDKVRYIRDGIFPVTCAVIVYPWLDLQSIPCKKKVDVVNWNSALPNPNLVRIHRPSPVYPVLNLAFEEMYISLPEPHEYLSHGLSHLLQQWRHGMSPNAYHNAKLAR
jgi:hypothetical protein